jgi:hypothetical protein
MHDQLAEKFAELFAECAATGDTSELRKEAAAHALVKTAEPSIADVLTNPLLLAPLGGATVGGLTGYYGTKKDKNKKRNAAIGALTGGLGGLSGAIAFGGKPVDGGGNDGDWTTNALKTPRYLADALGITGMGAAGSKFFGGVADKYFPSQTGELTRLAKQPGTIKTVADRVIKGKAPTNPYLKPLTELFDAHGPGGKSVTESFKPLPKVGPKPEFVDYVRGLTKNTPAYEAAIRSLNDARAVHASQVAARVAEEARHAANKPLAEAMLKSRDAGPVGSPERVKNVELLTEMINSRLGRKPINGTGTLHTDLGKVQRTTAKNIGRGAGGLIGGTVGGFGADWLWNLLQNRAAWASGNAPTLDNK